MADSLLGHPLLIELPGVEQVARLAVHALPQSPGLLMNCIVTLDEATLGDGIKLSLRILTLELH